MSVKGKIYGKYLKRAKYVVKGKKLKSPIATIQKREIMAQSKNKVDYIEKPVCNNASSDVNKANYVTAQAVKTNNQVSSTATAIVKSPVSNGKQQNMKKKENDISFAQLGQKIIEGEDSSKNSKSDSKTLMFVIVSLAIIIVAGMVKVGSMVYSEMSPKGNVASTKEKKDNNDELSKFLLGGGDNSDEDIVDEAEATVEPTQKPEITDEKNNKEDKTKDDNKEEILLTENDKVVNNNDDNNQRSDFVNPNNILDYLNQSSPTATPSKKPITPSTPTAPTAQPKPPITAGDNNSTNYTEIGSVSSACNIYHVSKTSIRSSAIRSYKYSKYKIEGGKVKVPTSDLNGIWFYDDGSGIKVLKGYENGNSVYINIASLYEKEDGDYVFKEKIYVITAHYIELDDEYSKDKDAEKGDKKFLMDNDYNLYKV